MGKAARVTALGAIRPGGLREILLPGVPPSAAGRGFARRLSVHSGRRKKRIGKEIPLLATFNL
jgi:hypothetical protein